MYEGRIRLEKKDCGRQVSVERALACRRLTCDLPQDLTVLPEEAKLVQHCLADLFAELFT